jgi:hypothetical protein
MRFVITGSPQTRRSGRKLSRLAGPARLIATPHESQRQLDAVLTSLAVVDRQIEEAHYRIGFDDRREMTGVCLPVEDRETELLRQNALLLLR